jgi:hypothetical protein
MRAVSALGVSLVLTQAAELLNGWACCLYYPSGNAELGAGRVGRLLPVAPHSRGNSGVWQINSLLADRHLPPSIP